MSHCLTAKVGMGAFDHTVLDRACARLGLPASRYEADGYVVKNERRVGWSVEVGFPFRVVFNDGPAMDAAGNTRLDANGNVMLEAQYHYENWTWETGGTYLPLKPLTMLASEYGKILDEDTLAMVQETQEIARQNNQATVVTEEEDGVMVVEVQLGG